MEPSLNPRIKNIIIDVIIKNLDNEVHPALSHIAWKDTESVSKALARFKQRDAVLLDGKIRYFRENTYFKESDRARYIRFGVSLGFLLLFWMYNRSESN